MHYTSQKARMKDKQMKDYERIRADVSKHFKNEIENLKLEIIRLKNENTDLQVENFTLKKDIQKYKNRLEISDGKKAFLCLNDTIKHLI